MKNLARYLRKRQLMERYGYESDRSIDNAVAAGRIPPPTIFQSRFPLWREDILDAHDAGLARAAVNRIAASRTTT